MVNIIALVVAASGSLKVYAEIPDPPPDPVTRLEENGAFSPSSHMPDRLYEFDVEAQTWGSTKSLAYNQVVDLVQTLRSHPRNQHGQITRFQLVSNIYERDTEMLVNGRPGPRYISILRLWARPQ